MERHLMHDLMAWKNRRGRKPLVLCGARQVGKTWLLREFGRLHFSNCVYLNFDDDPELEALFELGYRPKQLVSEIANLTHEDMVCGETLLVFDEVQECPKALTSLKYFCEEMPKLHVAAAGSLLGLVDHAGSGFPVGKVNFLTLHPMSFTEFLDAKGEAHLAEVASGDELEKLEIYGQRLKKLLKEYYVVGGMPEALAAFIGEESFAQARSIQNEILDGYRLDAGKHLAGGEAEKVLAAWDSIPAHLSRENKKFVFGHIRESARARDYRFAVTWLASAGIAVQVPRVTAASLPLSAYKDGSSFKLFLNDVGLLAAMAGLDPGSVVAGDGVFAEFKGALTEQYVCQQLVSECGLEPFYWSAANSRGEIDFLVQRGQEISAIEVKAEENLKSKSLRAFRERYPHVAALRLSLSAYREQDWMTNVPLYALAGALETAG
jgi:uncharacterized protein